MPLSKISINDAVTCLQRLAALQAGGAHKEAITGAIIVRIMQGNATETHPVELQAISILKELGYAIPPQSHNRPILGLANFEAEEMAAKEKVSTWLPKVRSVRGASSKAH